MESDTSFIMEPIIDPFGAVPEHLRCPVCMEVPMNKVFQCREGHPLCEECYSKISCCPQCRIPFGGEPIRTLLMENMLDEFALVCPYNESGCPQKVDRKSIAGHIESCSYNIAKYGPFINICKNLGFGSCTFQMNRGTVDEAVQHFQTAHDLSVYDTDHLEIEFAEFSFFSGGTKSIFLNRQQDGYAFLILITYRKENDANYLKWTPLYIRYPKPNLAPEPGSSSSSPYRVKCSLMGGDGQRLGWSVCPMDIFNFNCNNAGQTHKSGSIEMPANSFMDSSSGSVFARVKLSNRLTSQRKLGESKYFPNDSAMSVILTGFDMLKVGSESQISDGRVEGGRDIFWELRREVDGLRQEDGKIISKDCKMRGIMKREGRAEFLRANTLSPAVKKDDIRNIANGSSNSGMAASGSSDSNPNEKVPRNVCSVNDTARRETNRRIQDNRNSDAEEARKREAEKRKKMLKDAILRTQRKT